jgi:hypothetical protein
MGNNETIIKEYQNQSAVSNQAGRDPLLPRDNLAVDAAEAAEAEGGLTKGSPWALARSVSPSDIPSLKYLILVGDRPAAPHLAKEPPSA